MDRISGLPPAALILGGVLLFFTIGRLDDNLLYLVLAISMIVVGTLFHLAALILDYITP